MKGIHVPDGVSRMPAGFLLPLLLALGCADRVEETRDNDRNLTNNTASFIYNVIPQDASARISPEYSKAINTFAVNLLGEVYRDSGFTDANLVLSPFSVARNLAVLTEATSGESRKELLEALGGETALSDAKDALSKLLYADNSVILQCADALWFDSVTYALKAPFRSLVNTKYGVEVAGQDFTDASRAVRTINSWISDNTSGRIDDILTPTDITSETAAFLVNAIYFEADWTSPFDISETEKQDFFAPGGVVKVDMMSSEYTHETRSTESCENARLYYGTDEKDFFFLDIYMPTTGSIESFLRDSALSVLSDPDSADYGSVAIPRFFFTTEIELIPVLRKLGVKRVFDPGTAEITEMLEGPGAGKLYVDMVKHSAGIETDEEGTKAYAATVTGGATSAMPPEETVFDSPFVYFLRAGANGLVLFAGVVNNPAKTG